MPEHILNMLPVNEEERAAFEALAPDAVHEYAGRRTVAPEQLSRATVILGWPRPRDLVHAGRLRWLQTLWAGADEYLAPGVLPESVTVSCAAGAYSQAVSEYMLAALLSLCRKLPQYRDNQREHRWQDLGTVRTIRGATVLVVGAGDIGGAFARLCRALGARTVGLRRDLSKPVEGVDILEGMDRLDHWLPQADVVALTLPHTPETAGLVDRRRFGLMKQDAILISAGRGTVLDQDALADALRSGALWGAALDVCTPEPLPPEAPLWDLPNLILTPHVAGGIRMEASRKSGVAFCLENFRRYQAGEPLRSVVRQGR